MRRRPAIARRCNRVWTRDDERAMRASVAALRSDIDGAGGWLPWLETRAQTWLAPAPPHAARRRR